MAVHRKLKNLIVVLIFAVCLGVLGFCGYKIYRTKSDMARVRKTQEETALVVAEEEEKTDWSYMESYREKKEQNSDFVGWIKFDSGLINLPFMQNGDFYLRRDFNKNWDSCGTPYMNPNQKLDSDNITIYGHYVYIDELAMFTPLDKLRFPENYEENKIFRLYLDGEIRTYQVAAVVEYNIYGDWLFDVSAYSQEEWKSYLDYADQHKLYETGVELDVNNRYVTLQTCIRNRSNDRTIIVGKEISVEKQEK